MKPAEEWTESDFPRCEDGPLVYYPQAAGEGVHPGLYMKDGVVPYYCTDGEAFIYPRFTLMYLKDAPRDALEAHLRDLIAAWKSANPRLKERP